MMATKTVCDRCGSEAGTRRVRVEKSVIFDIWLPVGKLGYDLCQECRGELAKWLDDVGKERGAR